MTSCLGVLIVFMMSLAGLGGTLSTLDGDPHKEVARVAVVLVGVQ